MANMARTGTVDTGVGVCVCVCGGGGVGGVEINTVLTDHLTLQDRSHWGTVR